MGERYDKHYSEIIRMINKNKQDNLVNKIGIQP